MYNKSRLRQVVFTLFSLGISIAVFTYLLSNISIQELLMIIKGVSIRGVAAFLICSFFMSFFRTWRYLVLLRTNGQSPSSFGLYLVTIVRNFFSDLLPARLGTLIYIYLVQTRLGVPFGAATASFALAFVFDILALGFLIILAAVFISSTVLSTPVIIGGGAVLLILCLVVLLLLPHLLQLAATLAAHMPLIGKNYREKLHDAFATAKKSIIDTREAGIFSQVLFLSFGVRCFKYLSLFVLLLALMIPAGYEAEIFHLPRVLLGFCSAELAASLPVSGIAGFGAYEGAWALVFQLLGFPEKMAMVSSVSHHLFTQVYGYTIGVVALIILWMPFFSFQQSSMKQFENKKKFFLARFIPVFLSGLILILIFYPQAYAWLNKGTGVVLPAGRENRGDYHKNTIHQLVEGRVVYQRPDGIYSVKIGRKQEKRLSKNGSNPRWSPTGKSIVFVHRNEIRIMDRKGGQKKTLAQAQKAKAVCFDHSGKAVLFTDKKTIKRVYIKTGKIETILRGKYDFLELDISNDGKVLAVTVKTPLGYQVRRINLHSKNRKNVARGCSATLSPDSRYITVNGRKHRFLNLYNLHTLKLEKQLSAPYGRRFDNQFWSNHKDWLVSKSEDDAENIYIHHIPTDSSYQITTSGNCDRPDFYVSRSKI